MAASQQKHWQNELRKMRDNKEYNNSVDYNRKEVIQRIKQLQTLNDIVFKIIDFISQFEDELVKIWNKPKFVLNSNYVITLDKIAERKIDLVKDILEHDNFEKQVEEWIDLEIVQSNFNGQNILYDSSGENKLNDKFKYLPIDTKLFKDIELDILNLFKNLDDALDGYLIKSENYQALNTILPKLKGDVRIIYIDPPFNTGSDEFIYKDKYRHASWLSLMQNRLVLAWLLLSYYLSKNFS